jgi:hypothetical protein
MDVAVRAMQGAIAKGSLFLPVAGFGFAPQRLLTHHTNLYYKRPISHIGET